METLYRRRREFPIKRDGNEGEMSIQFWNGGFCSSKLWKRSEGDNEKYEHIPQNSVNFIPFRLTSKV